MDCEAWHMGHVGVVWFLVAALCALWGMGHGRLGSAVWRHGVVWCGDYGFRILKSVYFQCRAGQR